MHLYIATRGIKWAKERFINQICGIFLPTMLKLGKDKKKQRYMFETAVRPIELFEVVFPKEHKDLMLATILGPCKGITQHKQHYKWVSWIRKILGIKKIPEYKDKRHLPLSRKHVEVIALGLKEDKETENGEYL